MRATQRMQVLQPQIQRIQRKYAARKDPRSNAAQGCDAFITGEVSEQTIHSAREQGIHFFAAGHHATERYGIKALGEWLASEYGLDVEFKDIDNPA